MGRVNDIVKVQANTKNSIDILILKEKISLAFNENVNLTSQKREFCKRLKI